jgi:Kef-type K+ transport system membrane component KefB
MVYYMLVNQKLKTGRYNTQAMDGHIFTEISLLIALAAGMAMLMRALKQPLIIGHILTGLLVGPTFFGVVQSPEAIELLGEFGIVLLLFIVGLGLNPRIIKEIGKTAVLTGVGQVCFTVLFAFLMTTSLGYTTTEAAYISVALAFSSTIIILKLLSDKKEQNKLYGKISIGFLLVQDVIVAFALVYASAAGASLSAGDVGRLILQGLFVIGSVALLTKFVVLPLGKFLSRSQELLFLFAIAWGFGIGALFYELGFSVEIGALIAGVALANMTYAQEVASRLKPLRDFFLIIFFISLGNRLEIVNVAEYLGPAVMLSLLVLIGNPIIVMTILGLLGYTKKTGFKAGLAVAQISEFSLVFLLVGQRTGQIDDSILAIITLVALMTIAASTYMITYSDQLYKMLEPYLGIFERSKRQAEHESHRQFDAVLFGYKRGGNEFIKVLRKLTKRYVVVDYDPDVTDELERKRIPYIYGDATDPELLDEIDLSKVKLVISLASDFDTNVQLLRYLEHANPSTVVICHADTSEQAALLYGYGASYVMMPAFIGSEKVSSFIKRNGFSKREFKQYRDKHILYLQEDYEPKPLEP